jgi:hypothetical protein
MKDEREVEVGSVKTVEARADAEDSDSELTGDGVEEADGLIAESRFSVRDEESTDWLEPLTNDAPALLSLLDFNIALGTQTVKLTEEAFDRRFIWCLETLGESPISGDLLRNLYDRATHDIRQLSAFITYQDTLKSEGFNKTHDFIRDELRRLEQFAKIFSKPRTSVAPEGLSEWNAIWLGSLIELARTIAAQLLSADRYMVGQKSWLSSGRSLMESHLLSVAYDHIKSLRTTKRVSTSSLHLLVAYAHASCLVPFPTSESSSDPVAAMKARISRTRASKKRIEMLCLMLAQGLKQAESKH